MKAGRALDAFIAEQVMGFRCGVDKGNGKISWFANNAYGGEHTPPMAWKDNNYNVPNYSTNISDAWKVVKKFKSIEVTKSDDAYIVFIYDKSVTLANTFESTAESTAPLAICKAALLTTLGE